MRNMVVSFFSVCVLWVGLINATAAITDELRACAQLVKKGLREIPVERGDRFLGKVQKDTALCRGGETALKYRDTPWVDWSNYWATGDASTKKEGSKARTLLGEHLKPNGR
ncbi:MAG: hypothetical protein JKY67_04685, partial [Pseudomonadales bacterium]|nr:hypothetical protein [Pseudomonadales bacterium]